MEIFQIGLDKSLFFVDFLTKIFGFKVPTQKTLIKECDRNIYCLGKNLTEKYIIITLLHNETSEKFLLQTITTSAMAADE